MDPRTRALATDFTLAGAAVIVGLLRIEGPLVATIGIATVGLLVLVSVLYLVEHTELLSFIDELSPISLVVTFALALAVGLVLVHGRAVVRSPSATLLLGMGAGLGAYRYVYGVVRPLPAKRLNEMEQPSEIELDKRP